MPVTGWTGEEPGTEAPAMPMTAQLMSHRENRASVLEDALARSQADDAREALETAAAAPDMDERAAHMLTRGLAPGMISDLGQRLADVEAGLSAERAKIEKGERVTERVRGMLERGQLGALEAARMMDGDFGDAATVAKLERQAGRLRDELAGAQALIVPPQERELDGVEAASRAAHREFVEITRQRMAEAREGRPAPRPFGSVSRGAAARAEEQPVECPDCQNAGADWEQSVLIHHKAELDGVDLPQRSAHGHMPMIFR